MSYINTALRAGNLLHLNLTKSRQTACFWLFLLNKSILLYRGKVLTQKTLCELIFAIIKQIQPNKCCYTQPQALHHWDFTDDEPYNPRLVYHLTPFSYKFLRSDMTGRLPKVIGASTALTDGYSVSLYPVKVPHTPENWSNKELAG